MSRTSLPTRPVPRRLVLGAAAGLALLLPRPAAAEEWRIATLAPPGSAWETLLERGAEVTDKATDGRVTFKYFNAGLQGDDRDVVRKMKLGGLDGAVLTTTGLTMIDEHIYVLQLPRMFRDVGEMDYVLARMWPYFQKRFDERGYILGEPSDIGWIYLMTKREIRSLDELRRLKIWRWTGDKVANLMFDKLGFRGVPLGLPDVLPALMSGRIDACFGPPLAALAMQWSNRVRYVADTPSTYALAATVLRKGTFERASAKDQKKLRKIFRKLAKKSRRLVRRDGKAAYRVLLRRGMKVLEIPADSTAGLDELSEEAWHELADKLYTKAELEKVLRYRDEYRARQASLVASAE